MENENPKLKKFMTRDEPNKNNHPRIGEVNYKFSGSPMIITDYRNNADIDVCIINILSDGTIKYNNICNRMYNHFKNGKDIKSPYDKATCGIGYIGEGYRPKDVPEIYRFWNHMLTRTNSIEFKIQSPSYKDVKLHPWFENFQNFIKWYNLNYYKFPNEKMCVDKDIIFKGNKIYGPDTCCFVPERINLLFLNRKALRGNLPIGVYFENYSQKYCIEINKFKKRFKTSEEAFYVYRARKLSYIKEVADDYLYNKGGMNIPQFRDVFYPAMLRYDIEITD